MPYSRCALLRIACPAACFARISAALIGGEFCSAGRLVRRMTRSYRCSHVGNVVRLRANKQMIGDVNGTNRCRTYDKRFDRSVLAFEQNQAAR